MTRHSRSAQAYFVLNGITQFYLPNTHFIPARAKLDLEHYIRNELLNVAADLPTPTRWKPESSCVPGKKTVKLRIPHEV